ncbi:MAG: hypothetical protein OXG72_21300 [Acidobacteria bacterium]|nr:hypothetical protein [Acidobacteriota bacterium]
MSPVLSARPAPGRATMLGAVSLAMTMLALLLLSVVTERVPHG